MNEMEEMMNTIDIFNDKTRWMLHEVSDEQIELLKKLDPEKNVLFWDDAVLSQYKALLELSEYTHVLAVSTNITTVATETWDEYETHTEYETTMRSHSKWFRNNDASSFMNWNQIKELQDHGVIIAGHGYKHLNTANSKKPLLEAVADFKAEIELVLADFKKYLDYRPSIYVYPYNQFSFWSNLILQKEYNMVTINRERRNILRFYEDPSKYIYALR